MPSLNSNPFIDGYSLGQIQTLQGLYQQAVQDIGTTGQSYVINGRTFTAANLQGLKDTLLSINQAVRYLGGGGAPVVTQVQPQVPCWTEALPE